VPLWVSVIQRVYRNRPDSGAGETVATTSRSNMTKFNRWWPILLVFCVAASCSTDDYPTSGADASRTIKANPSFTLDIQEIFDRRSCSSSPCHGVSQSAGMDLRSGSAYGNLVGKPSTESALRRVAPGSVDSSYIIQKLEGSNTIGGQMPLGDLPLDVTDLQNIKNWIAQGALSN
jgi:hypothetical protein